MAHHLADLKNAIRHGRSMSRHRKSDQSMRIAVHLGYAGMHACAFVRGFQKELQNKEQLMKGAQTGLITG